MLPHLHGVCDIRTDNTRKAAAVCALLLLAVALVFGQTVGHEFINYDDDQYVYENPQVTGGLTARAVAWAITAGHASNWHPLTWLSHMLDVQLFGLNAGGHHLTNVLLHAAVAILLFLVLWRMTGALWRSAFVAAVFAVHPLRVESVAWVAERKDVLSGLFFMLTLWAYVGYARRPFSLGRYLMVTVLFGLGLMAKPMLVTLPLVLLLLDYWPLGRMGLPAAAGGSFALSDRELKGTQEGQAVQKRSDARRAKPEERVVYGNTSSDEGCSATQQMSVFQQPRRVVIEKLPLLALTAASCVATFFAQGRAVIPIDAIPISSRIANALVSYVAYIGKFFYPVGLAIFYPHPGVGLPIGEVVGSTLALAGITTAVLIWRRRFPYLLVGWFWYVGMLVPVIGLVQVGEHSMADRYTYLPQIGLCLSVTWGIAQLTAPWRHRRWVCGAASLLAVLVLMGLAWRQTSHWRDNETLWTHVLASTANNYRAHNNLGVVMAERGAIDEAIAHYRKALEIRPSSAEALNNLGVALAGRGEVDEAIADYQKALRIEPDDAKTHNNLGIALANRGRMDEAIAHYRKALEIKPDSAKAHFNLGLALDRQGKTADAVIQWRESVRLQPDHTNFLNQLAWVLATCPTESIRNGAEAVDLAERAVRSSGGQEPAILDTLAAAYAEAGRFTEAVATVERAVSLASVRGDTAMADILRPRIELYQARFPHRETRR